MKQLLVLLLLISTSCMAQAQDDHTYILKEYFPDTSKIDKRIHRYVKDTVIDFGSGPQLYIMLKNILIADMHWKSPFDEPKYDTVQGWVMYYRRVFQYIGFGSFPCLLYYGDSATAIYRKAEGNEHWGSIHQYNPEHGYLVQILVDGKEFDIRKKYEFIDDKDVVKKKLRVLNDK